MTFAAWLLAMIGPIAVKALVFLGVGVVTYTGVSAGLGSLITMAQTSWAGLPADVLQLSTLAGIPDAIGIVAGAMTARVATWAATQAKRFILN